MSNITEKLEYLKDTKRLIKETLIQSGQPVSDTDTFRSYVDKIKALGGSSADVRYVTFMNGDTELYKKPVAVGDDCADVVTRGLISTPTKESTVQYDYTYSGWSFTDGGTAETENALASVTEDRTVYAAYTSSKRTYTITYYDGDTVLKIDYLEYYATPSFAPTKDGFSFIGWEPAITTVTGDANYYAQWQSKLTFAGGSWADIAAVSEAGEAEQYFAIGDTKQITFSFLDGTSQTVNATIVGFNHDDLADGSGKAGMSIMLTSQLNHSSIKIEEDRTYGTGYIWETSKIRRNLNNASYEPNKALPAELRNVIKSVTKTSNSGFSDDWNGGKKYGKNALYTTSDKVWLPSATELGIFQNDSYVASGQGVKYPYYTGTSRLILSGTSSGYYGTRSMHTQYANSTCGVIGRTGAEATQPLGWENAGMYGYVFGFCI